MPSTSKKQHNFMAAVANNPAFAKKAGVPQSVGKEFNEADTGRKFLKGGDMKESKAMMKKEVSFMKKKGAPKSMLKHEMAEMKGMKKGGSAKKMAMGGMGQMPITPRPPNPGPIVNRLPTRGTTPGKPIKEVINPVRPLGPRGSGPNDAGPGRTVTGPRRPLPQAINKPSGMAKGGLAAGHKSADGIARKGKTKAEQVKMAKGGTAKMRKGGYC